MKVIKMKYVILGGILLLIVDFAIIVMTYLWY